MEKELFQEYAVIDAQIKELTKKKDVIKESIIEDIQSRAETKEETPVGRFTIYSTKKWTYTQKVADMVEEVKTQKAKEESVGDATCEETPSLRFTPIKL